MIYNLVDKKPILGFSDFSKRAATEGIVLLKNENQILPIQNKKINIFGRTQINYFKSGTGSGGLVNVSHVTNILEALEDNPLVTVNQNLKNVYTSWLEDHPYDAGNGMWASEPWSQIEMPLEDSVIQQAREYSDIAIVVIGRTAGEDKDHFFGPGSFCLTKEEENMLDKITKAFDKVVLLLNVGNVIDMSFLDRYSIPSVLYIWHGGMEGGRAVSEILTGLVTPSGHLPDTIYFDFKNHPAGKNYGATDEVFYEEDIYVGYRYTETFHPEYVRFPFGYGLSYTNFHWNLIKSNLTENGIHIAIEVTNTGNKNGKDVVQFYITKPQGKLGNPKYVLAGFFKTKCLMPQEKEYKEIFIPFSRFASFDDTGITGHPHSFVFEDGKYILSISKNVKEASFEVPFVLKELLVEEVSDACTPNKSFNRIHPELLNDTLVEKKELVNAFTHSMTSEMKNLHTIIPDIPYVEKNLTLPMVYRNECTLDEFIETLTEDDMICLSIGEGMSSPKVLPGTGCAYAGHTKELQEKGVPVCCGTDGPSGIRMDSGLLATSLPIGTLLASSFNTNLVEELYFLEGIECRNYGVDTLLGPGLNIHRYPLCGRNFEYFSEDPVLTGEMALAVTKGLQRAGVTGTLKHFACNNQETARFDCNSIVSQRALREIYLKAFEIAVREGHAQIIMSSYNPLNGVYTASNYDLITKILRNDWHYDGIVVTDWWAKGNFYEEIGKKESQTPIILAQNDIYMVSPDARKSLNYSNILEGIKLGWITRGIFARNLRNILKFVMKTPTFLKSIQQGSNQVSFEYSYPRIMDSLKTTYYEAKDISLEKYIKNNEFYEKNGTRVLSLLENGEQTIYYFLNRQEKTINNSFIDFSMLKPKHTFELKNVAWYKANIPLNQEAYHSSKIKISETCLDNLLKNEYISYNIQVEEYGKYIIELDVSSDDIEIAQTPFSFYIDQELKATLTVHGTNGNAIHINAQILIDKGNHFFTLKFLSAGLKVYSILIVKHN